MPIFSEKKNIVVLNDFTAKSLYAPAQMTHTGLTICTAGECCMEVNGKQHILRKGELLAVTVYSIGRIVYISDDFKATLVAISPKMLLTFRLIKAGQIAKYITLNPILTIDKATTTLIIQLIQALRPDEDDSHIIHELNVSLLASIFYTALLCFHDKFKHLDHTTLDKGQILASFLSELQAGCKKHRDVSHYALMFNMTSKHFGQFVKDITGETATVWIQRVTLDQIKTYLQSEQYSVKDIAILYNFASINNFYDYFKKHTSMTISEFKRISRKM